MGIYEYEEDRSVRRTIERVLTDATVIHDLAFETFRSRISAIDGEFRDLLQESETVLGPDSPWWERGVLKISGPDLAEDYAEHFRVAVQVVGSRTAP
jgi:hypothetical protein